MKGIIFNLLEQFIIDQAGEEKYEEVLDESVIETKDPFVGPGSYPDTDLFAIIGKVVEKLGMPLPDALRAFGRFCIPQLAKKFPAFMEPHNHPKAFLKTVDDIHYVELVKIFPDATPPHFVYRDQAPDKLIIEYRSERKLCAFMEGLIEGVGDYYKSPIQYKQKRCMHKGDELCEFELTFTPAEK